MEGWDKFVLWGLVGILVLFGGIVTSMEGLPWQTRTESTARAQLVDERMLRLSEIEESQGKQIESINLQVATLIKLNVELQTRLDDLLQQLQRQKIDKLEQKYHAQKFARKLDQKHYESEIRRSNDRTRNGEI